MDITRHYCSITIWILLFLSLNINATEYTEDQLKLYLNTKYETQASAFNNRLLLSLYEVETDVGNKEKTEEGKKLTLESAAFEKEQWTEYFRDANWTHFTDPIVKRQVMILSVLGNSILKNEDRTALNQHLSSMMELYSTAKICPYKKQDCNLTTEGLALEPDITKLMAESRDYDELLYAWVAWRNATGPYMKEDFSVYVNISNEAAQLNGYEDMGDMWRSYYDSDTFVDDVDDLWDQVKPLYDELYTYVKRKLIKFYGDKLQLDEDGLLPAHIFGNMWAQRWVTLYDIVCPYPKARPFNTTKALLDQNYTILDMFKTADKFYQSMGLLESSMSYNESIGAMIRKPKDKEVVCHASAWDFSDGKDFRIKMCTSINAENFETIHHEMGHIQYFMQYAKQPYAFRDGANPGFHEAIGDTIALSVSTPTHLKKIGLMTDYVDTKEDNINALMQMALDKVAFLPYGLLIDKWRWDVFNGSIPESEWNSHWWKLREEIQMVKAPVRRNENDFDPGAKFHVASGSDYIAYFVAQILQFQFHRSLCIEADQYDPDDKDTTPLHKCDFYQSEVAGKLLSSGLQLGSSAHWNEVLYAITGERELNASAMLEYFEPLQTFLEKANAEDANVQAETESSEKKGEQSNQIMIICACLLLGVFLIGGIVWLVAKTRRCSSFSVNENPKKGNIF